MNVDTPYLEQRSIVAYSGLRGTPLAGEWYLATLRKPFSVSCRTSATVTITAGANISSHIRAVVSGTSINIECLFDSTGYPSEEWGVSGSGTLTLEVVTAGDETQNLEGATATFYVNVLVLEYDMPYGLPLFAEFRHGESVNMSLAPTRYAFDWETFSVRADGGTASGGQSICAYVNGTLQDSGLILHNDNGDMWISGWAARPGVYRVYFDLESRGSGDARYHPFKGGKGENVLIIWVYEDYLPGDLVVLFPSPAAGAEGEPPYIAAPFAPAKAGDVGLVLDIPAAADAPPPLEPVRVVHSLNNRFAGAGSLAALMDGIAGATWKRYPLRRLLSLFSVGATVTMHFSARETTDYYLEEHNPSGEYPESDNSGDYPDGVPSVSQVDDAPGKEITVRTVEDWTKEQRKVTASASADVTLSLSYALWSDGFPKYLEALLNRASTYSNRQSNYSHDRTRSTKFHSSTKTYALETISEAEAIARGIPFPGDGQGGGNWAIFSGTATFIYEEYHGDTGEVYYTETTTWQYVNGAWAFVSGNASAPVDVLSATVGTTGNVTVIMTAYGETATATDKGVATASASWDELPPGDDPSGADWSRARWTVKAAAKGTQDSPGATTNPHAGRNNGGGTVTVVYSRRETLAGDESRTLGNASTTAGGDFDGHGTCTLVFGEGRELSWAHRSIVAAGSGEGGISVAFSVANGQRQVETTTTHGGVRERSGGAAAWTYINGSAATWGTTTTTTATDEDQPATVGQSLNHDDTFHTGILALILAAANMGSLSFSRNRTTGSGDGEVFAERDNPQTGDRESADIDPVSGGWIRETVTATGAPSGGESSGEVLDIDDLDLSGEIDPEDWEQWSYSYSRQERKITTDITISITDSEYSTP